MASSGASDEEIKQVLGLKRLGPTYKAAKDRLGLRTGLSKEPVKALLNPRTPGCEPPRGYLPVYSSRAITIDKIYELELFYYDVAAVSCASDEMETLGLEELERWLSGQREAVKPFHEVKPASALAGIDYDVELRAHTDGLRIDDMRGALHVVELNIVDDESAPDALCGALLGDVHDPDSSMIMLEGTLVAFCLAEEDQVRWRAIADDNRRGNRAVRLCHLAGREPGIGFELL